MYPLNRCLDVSSRIKINEALEKLSVGKITDEEETSVNIDRNDLTCLEILEVDSLEHVIAFERINGSIPDEVHLLILECLFLCNFVCIDMAFIMNYASTWPSS